MATRRRVYTSDGPDLVYGGVTWPPDYIKYFKKRRENGPIQMIEMEECIGDKWVNKKRILHEC